MKMELQDHSGNANILRTLIFFFKLLVTKEYQMSQAQVVKPVKNLLNT